MRYVNQVLRKELNQESTIYMNDIFIMDKKITKHREKIRRILEKLQETGLQTKQNKYKFEKSEIEILERIINKEGVKSNSEHLQAIRK